MRIYASLVFVSHGVVNACETNTRLEPARTWPLPIQRPGVPTGVRKDLAATQTIMRISLYSNVLCYVDKYTYMRREIHVYHVPGECMTADRYSGSCRPLGAPGLSPLAHGEICSERWQCVACHSFALEKFWRGLREAHARPEGEEGHQQVESVRFLQEAGEATRNESNCRWSGPWPGRQHSSCCPPAARRVPRDARSR